MPIRLIGHGFEVTVAADNMTVDAKGLDSARAWIVALASALAVGVSFGTIYTFGTFFDAMAEEFEVGLGATSIVFSITVFLFFGSGAVTGTLADRWGVRPLVLIGGALFAAGLVATSMVQELWQGYLFYGVGAGFGGGIFMSQLFATTAAWFVRYRALAQGVVATGSGIGTLILSPLAERMIAENGWRDAYVVLGVIAAISFSIAGLVIRRPPVPAPTSAKDHRRAVVRTANFRWLSLAGAAQAAAMISAFAFIVPLAKDQGVSSSTAALLIGVIGASSIFGRLLLTGFSSRVGPVRMLQLCLAGHPLAFLVWLSAGGRVALLFLFVIVLGLAYGGFVALVGEVTAHLFGIKGLGSVMGLVYFMAGVGGLLYPPFVGFVADHTSTATPAIIAIVAASVVGALAVSQIDDRSKIQG